MGVESYFGRNLLRLFWVKFGEAVLGELGGAQRNHESWLVFLDKDRVPDDAAFERRYQEFLTWVSGDEVEPTARYFYPTSPPPSSPGLGDGA